MNRDDVEYEGWLAERRALGSDADLAEPVMERVRGAPDVLEGRSPAPPIASRGWRVAVSVAALVLGLSRFVYLAIAARLIVL